MIVIKAGKVRTMGQEGIIENAVVLVEDDKIKGIGRDLEVPAGAEVYDYSDRIVTPGLIDAHTHLGIGEEGLGWEGRDYNEMTSPVTPELRAIDAINPEDQGLQDAREHGITTVMAGPGSANVIGGECLALKTGGQVIDEMIVKNPVGIKAAFGENPKRVYNGQNKMPSTRMAIAALMRKTFIEAEDYLHRKKSKENEDEPFERDIKMESIIRVLNKEIPLKAHGHRADDIMTILRIGREFNIDLTLEHCTEGHKIAEEIARSGFPAIVGPTISGKVKVELKEKNQSPSTRMAVAALLRKTFVETENYLAKKNSKKDDEPFERDLKYEALIPVLQGELPLKTHAHRADDIMTALRIAREFSLKLTVEHCTEGHKVAEELAKAGVPAVVGPSMTTRSKVEVRERDFKTAAVLAEAGVTVAIMSDHPVVPVHNLTFYAALTAKAGLPREEAFRAITINPARILGIDDRVGSLEEGKDADLVVFSEDPFEMSAEVEAVFISGEKLDED